MHSRFLPGKRVMITGHTGFKGSRFALWFVMRGARVLGYSLAPPTVPSLFDAIRIERDIEHVTADVRDLPTLSQTVSRFSPDIIVHMAAQSLVRASYTDPVSTFDVNAMGTVNVLEAARRCESVKVIVIVTSDKCYDNRQGRVAFRETDALGGEDPYSASKACAELVTGAYRNLYRHAGHDARIATVRAGNVIGGGDWARDRLLPDLMLARAEGRTTRIRYPHSVRPWQHALDALNGYMTLIERLWDDPGLAGAYNFGPQSDTHVTVGEIADMVAAQWPGPPREIDPGPHPPEAPALSLDSAKARDVLGWAPRLSLENALEWTVSWHKAYEAGSDMRTVTEAEIETYERLVAGSGL